jgi:hypothetical protein
MAMTQTEIDSLFDLFGAYVDKQPDGDEAPALARLALLLALEVDDLHRIRALLDEAASAGGGISGRAHVPTRAPTDS